MNNSKGHTSQSKKKGVVKWTPTPKYFLRWDCVKSIIQFWPPGTFLEIGPGRGGFTRKLLDWNFTGYCFELGEKNRMLLRESFSFLGNKIHVLEKLTDMGKTRVSYLFAFEVLEHIQDDKHALKEWLEYLDPGGQVMLSVPAHNRKFSIDDQLVGHLRRYEQKEIVNLLKECGCTDIHIRNYGFPLGNLTRWIGNYFSNKGNTIATEDHIKRSVRSGTERPVNTLRMSHLFRKELFFPFIILQRLFYSMDLGDGYVIWGKKL